MIEVQIIRLRWAVDPALTLQRRPKGYELPAGVSKKRTPGLQRKHQVGRAITLQPCANSTRCTLFVVNAKVGFAWCTKAQGLGSGRGCQRRSLAENHSRSPNSKVHPNPRGSTGATRSKSVLLAVGRGRPICCCGCQSLPTSCPCPWLLPTIKAKKHSQSLIARAPKRRASAPKRSARDKANWVALFCAPSRRPDHDLQTQTELEIILCHMFV